MIEIDLKSRYYILFYFRYENETGLGFFFLQEEFIFSINHKKKKTILSKHSFDYQLDY